ncbi:hypothetical protein [Ferruginibacter sp. SUN106]|uniref:hypothetical protein n=1 Tax=Ferruginibacter sp. SUN106 TaxID=2978348 RepID=UPI003D36F410
MKRVFVFSAAIFLLACNGSGSDNNTAAPTTGNSQTGLNTPPGATSPLPTRIFVEGSPIDLGGTALLQKDKEKLQPGADYLVTFTAPGGATSKASLVLNFLMALKPGSYPIVGMNFKRPGNPYTEIYGGEAGAKPKLTNYKVNITECKDLGDNHQGGHKWSISGTFDELVIPALPIMLVSKTRHHPVEIKIQRGTFTNVTFDDNWEAMVQQEIDKAKK